MVFVKGCISSQTLSGVKITRGVVKLNTGEKGFPLIELGITKEEILAIKRGGASETHFAILHILITILMVKFMNLTLNWI